MSKKYIQIEDEKNHFLNNEETMSDWLKLSKDEFLEKYSHITEEEYDETLKRIEYEGDKYGY